MSVNLNYFEKKIPYFQLRKKLLFPSQKIKSDIHQSLQDYRDKVFINNKIMAISPFKKSKMAQFYRTPQRQMNSVLDRLSNSYDISQQKYSNKVNHNPSKRLNQSQEYINGSSIGLSNTSNYYGQYSVRQIDNGLAQQTSYQAQKFLFQLLEHVRPSVNTLPKKEEDSYQRLARALENKFNAINLNYQSPEDDQVEQKIIQHQKKNKVYQLMKKNGNSQKQKSKSPQTQEKYYFSIDERQANFGQNNLKPLKILEKVKSNHKLIRNNKIKNNHSALKLPKFGQQVQHREYEQHMKNRMDKQEIKGDSIEFEFFKQIGCQ